MDKRTRFGVLLSALTIAAAGLVARVAAQPRNDAGPGPGLMGSWTVAQGMMGQGMMGPGMMQSPASPAPGVSGNVIFRSQCSQCHGLRPGPSSLPGPSLHGIFGRKAGTAPGYSYTAAMRDSGVVWNDRTLDQFIEAPQSYIHGDNMPFPGISDKTARQRLIAYLKAATK